MTTGQADPWTVLRLLEWTTDYFKKHGSTSPRLDAEVLLAEARGSSRIDLYTAFNSEPSPEVREAFREMVRRRGEGTPVAYLVGHKEFYSIRLRVNEATLIPRPETEHLVIEALDRAKESSTATESHTLRIADVGTGSGAVAIALAMNLKTCQITATDISASALEVARYNVEQHELGDRVELLEGDLFAPIEPSIKFDIICSNPPYVSSEEFDSLDSEVREFEPKSALVSGPTGLEVIERLIREGHDRLQDDGWLLVELSPMIADAALNVLAEHGGYQPGRLVKDLAGHRRILAAQKRPG